MFSKIFRYSVRLSVLKSPFFYALLPSLLFYVDVFKEEWVPIHDTFQVTNVSYFFFNEFVQNGIIPLWYPYINYGVDTNWFLAISFGPSLAFLLPFAKLFSHIDFLSLYYASLFLDELILLVGGYLLARFLFKASLTAVFVSIALTGSTLWYGQVWYNFHFYYVFPLSLYLALKGCVESSAWRIILGASLLVLTSFGNLPYLILMQGLTFLVFFATCVWSYDLNWKTIYLKLGKEEFAAGLLGVFGAVAYVLLLVYGVEHINYNPGREHGNIVDLGGFLTYGGNLGLRKFSELFTGTSWSLDINIYAGILVFSLAIFGLLWAPSRRQLPFLMTAIVLTLLSLGEQSFVAPLVYYIPGMAYYRHIGLVLPLIKLMLIFLAGFGFDAVVQHLTASKEDRTGETKSLARINMLILATMMFVCCLLTGVHLATQKRSEVKVFSIEPQRGSDVNRFADRWEYSSRIVFVSVLYVTGLLIFGIVMIHGSARGVMIGFALLGLHVVDVYSYRSSHFHANMVKVDPEYLALFRFRPTEFASKRLQNYFDNTKFATLSPYLSPSYGKYFNTLWFENCVKSNGKNKCWFPEGLEYGTFYNTLEPFVGIDPCRTIFRSDYWLPGIDRLYRAKTGLPLGDPKAMPEGYETREIVFPRKDSALNKIIGCEVPKIQIFRSVSIAKSEKDLANLIEHHDFDDGILLTSRGAYDIYQMSAQRDVKARLFASPSAEVNTKLESSRLLFTPSSPALGKVKVEGFSADRLTVRISTGTEQDHYWFYYADAWHPFWRAYVNKKEVPILKVNFGFKAVEIPPGNSVVEFVYSSYLLIVTSILALVSLAVMMLLVLWQSYQLLFPSR